MTRAAAASKRKGARGPAAKSTTHGRQSGPIPPPPGQFALGPSRRWAHGLLRSVVHAGVPPATPLRREVERVPGWGRAGRYPTRTSSGLQRDHGGASRRGASGLGRRDWVPCSAISVSTSPTSNTPSRCVLRPAHAAARLRAVPHGRGRPRFLAGRRHSGAPFVFLYEATEAGASSTGGARGCSIWRSSSRGARRAHRGPCARRPGRRQAPSSTLPAGVARVPAAVLATFWLDPFGIMLEAVCHHDRD